jgi:Icc-related predicted phosphoesterase
MLSLSDYIAKEFTVNGTKSSRIILFDVDDTLIHTTAQIHIKKNGKLVKKISNAEYNEYKLGPGEEFDYEEFDDPNILDNEAFTKYWKTLKREYQRGTHIGILTARGDCDMIFDFFKKKGIEIKRELVFAIGDPKLGLTGTIAEKKSTIISKSAWLGYRTFIFFDDNESNLKSAKQLERKYNIKMISVKA